MLQLVKALPFFIPPAWKSNPIQENPFLNVHCRELYPLPSLSWELWREWKGMAACEVHVSKIGLNNFIFENRSCHIVELTEKFTFNVKLAYVTLLFS